MAIRKLIEWPLREYHLTRASMNNHHFSFRSLGILAFVLLIAGLMGFPSLLENTRNSEEIQLSAAMVLLPETRSRLRELRDDSETATLPVMIKGEVSDYVFVRTKISSDSERETFRGHNDKTSDLLSLLFREDQFSGQDIVHAILSQGDTLHVMQGEGKKGDPIGLIEERSEEEVKREELGIDEVLESSTEFMDTVRSTTPLQLRGAPPAPKIFEIAVDYANSAIQIYGIQNSKDFVANAINSVQPGFDRELGVTLQVGYQHFWLPSNYTGTVPPNTATESYTVGPEPMTASDGTTRLIQLRQQWSLPGFVENSKDGVLLITTLNIYGVQGIAIQGAACSLAAPSIARRGSGSYDIRVVGHELGHLLGGGHSGTPHYLAGTTTVYDMMYNGNTGINPLGFSPTQVGYIMNRFNSGSLNCLSTSVTRPWIISELPASVTVQEGNSFSINFNVGGGEPMTYQWHKYIGSAIELLPTVTGPTLSSNSAVLSDAGTYQVEAFNPAGSTGKKTVTVTVTPNPVVACPFDFTADQRLSIDDLFAYLNLWFLGNIQADINGNGTPGIDDLFLFLNGYFTNPTGC